VAAVVARNADLAVELLSDLTRRNVGLLADSMAKADLLIEDDDQQGPEKRRRTLRGVLD
jgi:hypothetical protein